MERIEAIRRRTNRRLFIALAALTGLLLIGTAGYHIIAAMSPVDALYMAVITLTTVGFGEITPLGPEGRLFTIALLIGGGGVAAYALSTLTEMIFSGEWQMYLNLRRQRTMLAQLSGHTIVCGYGRVGRHVADELHAQKSPFVVVDMDLEKVERVRNLGYMAIQGNGADEEDLQVAGIERAASLVATASSDAENVFIVLTARAMRPDLVIVARANYDDSEDKLRRAGATRVILPYRICGRRMAATLARPGVADFLDEVMHASSLEFLIDQVPIGSHSSLVGKTLGETSLRAAFGVTVLAVQMPGMPIDTSPGADTVLNAGSLLIVLGTREQISALLAQASGE
ncbi:MAG: potassium channel protein [Oscillochloris sp.]|nr:potassium channel protein [Oscillochloris sp.]